MDELGAKFNTLSKNEQAYVATTLFGTYQRNRGLTLLKNYNDSLKNYENALNAAGTASQKFAIYQDSVQAKLDSVTASWEGFWQKSINSNLLKGALTVLANLIDGFSVLTKEVGILPVVLGAATLAFSLFSKTAFSGIMVKVAESVATLAVNLGIATGAATTLATAMAAIAPLAIFTAIVGAIKIVDSLTTSLEEQREKVTKLSSDIDTLSISYDNLKNKENRTPEEEQYLKLLEKELAIKKEILVQEAKTAVNKEYFSPLAGSYRPGTAKTGEEQINRNIKELADLQDALKNASSATEYDKIKFQILNIQQSLISSSKSIKDYVKTLGTNAPAELVKLDKTLDGVINKFQTQSTTIAKTAETTSQVNTVFTSLTANEKTFAQAVEDADKAFKSSIDNIQALNTAQDELASNHKLSSKTLETLLLQYPQLLQYLGNEKKLTEELSKLINSETENQQELYAKKLELSEQYFNLYIKGNAETWNKVKLAYGADAENFKIAADAKKDTDDTLRKYLGDRWSEFYGSEEKALNAFIAGQEDAMRWLSPDQQKQSQALIDSAKRQLEAIKAMNEPIKLSFKNIDWSGLDTKDKKTSSSPSPINTDLSDEYIKLANAEAEIDQQQIKHLDTLISISEKQKDYNKELSLTQQKIELQTKTIKDLKKANESLHQSAVSSRSSFASLGSYYAGLDTESWFDKNGQATKQYLDLIDSFNGKTDTLSKQRLANIQKEFNELQKIKQAYNENINAIESMNDALLDSKLKVSDLSKAQTEATQKANDEALKIYNDTQNQIIDLLKQRYDKEKTLRERDHEDTIQKLDDQLDAFKDYIDKQKNEIDRLYDTQDYQENVAESSEKILEYQAEIAKRQIAANSGDLTAMAEIKDYQEKLEEERKNLAKTQRDREKELRKQNLDDTLNSFEKTIEAQKRAENDSYESFKRSMEDKTNEMALQLEAQQLLMTGTITDVQNALIDLFTSVGANATTTGQIIQQQLIDKIAQLRNIGSNLSTITAESSGNNPLGMNRADFATYLANKKEAESTTSLTRKAELRAYNQKLRDKYGITEDKYSYNDLVGYYANGTPDVLSLVGERGRELRILNPNGKDSIIPNGLTERLVSFAKNPVDFMFKFTPNINIPQLTPVSTGFNMGNIVVNVNGSISDANIKRVNDNITIQLKDVFTKAGIVKR